MIILKPKRIFELAPFTS